MYRDGSFRVLRVAGIDVFVHWSWFLVAVALFKLRPNPYHAQAWNVVEYLALFGIVLLHELGHVLACRSVGGQANTIVLWPLGGMALVSPPPRPGPVLWSIAAGPLVNLVLVPVTLGLFLALATSHLLAKPGTDLDRFLFTVAIMNLGLLVCNLAPIYPLDGGQIVHALLWFVIGRWHALRIVSVLGMVCAAGAILLALAEPGRRWLGTNAAWSLALIAVFVGVRGLVAFRQANAALRLLRLPRHQDAACPACGEAPPAGPFQDCDECAAGFDPFASPTHCPVCAAPFRGTPCLLCRYAHPIEDWDAGPGGAL